MGTLAIVAAIKTRLLAMILRILGICWFGLILVLLLNTYIIPIIIGISHWLENMTFSWGGIVATPLVLGLLAAVLFSAFFCGCVVFYLILPHRGRGKQ
jgi:hypothetical protein